MSERQTPQDLLWKPPATARNLGPHQRRPYVFLEDPASLIKGEGRKKHTVKLILLLPDINLMRAAAVWKQYKQPTLEVVPVVAGHV